MKMIGMTNSRDIRDNPQSYCEGKHLPIHPQQLNHSNLALSRENATHMHPNFLRFVSSA